MWEKLDFEGSALPADPLKKTKKMITRVKECWRLGHSYLDRSERVGGVYMETGHILSLGLMKNHVFPRGIFLDRCKSSFEGAVRDRVPPKIAILR